LSSSEAPTGQRAPLESEIDTSSIKVPNDKTDNATNIEKSPELDTSAQVGTSPAIDNAEHENTNLIPTAWVNPSPIPSDEFPHINSATLKPLPTLENIAFMLVYYRIRVTYNVISKRVDIIIPGLQGSPDNIDNAAHAIIISLASLNHINSGHVMMYIGAIANENSYNPIQEWIGTKAWDGTDRIKELTATLVLAEDYPSYLRDILLKRWLLSAGAAALMPGFYSRGVLTLQGPQSIGKTAWIYALLPPGLLRESYIKLDHHLDPSNKDSLISAICHWIVEIGELDSSFKKDIARLKGYITAPNDKVRVPYGRRASEYPRRTVFIATVNTDQFLVDDTGNTRWWTIAVKSINYQHNIDMQQLWAQVAHMLEHDKERWWLEAREEEALEWLNRKFMKSSVVADLLDSALDWTAPTERYRPKTATQVLKMIGIDRPTNQQARDCGSELRVRLGPPKKSQGQTRWYVPPVKTSLREDDDMA